MRDVFHQFRDKKLTDFIPGSPEQEKALLAVTDYIEIENLHENLSAGRGLCFYGETGTGKTMLACMVLAAASNNRYLTECIEMSTYVDLCKDMFRLSRSDDLIDLWRPIYDQIRFIRGVSTRRARLLLLDDIGREFPAESGWSDMMLFDMLRYRFNRGLPTLLTTNMSIPELDQRYTEGFTSFLSEAGEMIFLNGADYRLGGGERAARD